MENKAVAHYESKLGVAQARRQAQNELRKTNPVEFYSRALKCRAQQMLWLDQKLESLGLSREQIALVRIPYIRLVRIPYTRHE